MIRLLRKILPMMLLLLIAAGALCCGSCGRDSANDEKKPVLAVSYDSQRALLEKIVGDDFEIIVLLPPGSDPEMYEPDMRSMASLGDASAYLTTSTLGFESQTAERIRANYPRLPISDLTSGLRLITDTHSVGRTDSHAASHAADPHLLSSIENARQIAANMLSVVNNLNPADSAQYNANFRKLSANLTSLSNRCDSLLRPLKEDGGAFLVMHPALSYFARDYGLTQLSLEHDGKEASPRQLQQRLEEARERGVKVLFYERGESEAKAAEIAKSIGAQPQAIYLNGADFLEEVENAAEVLGATKTHLSSKAH